MCCCGPSRDFAAKQPDWRLAIMGEGPEEMGLRELGVSSWHC